MSPFVLFPFLISLPYDVTLHWTSLTALQISSHRRFRSAWWSLQLWWVKKKKKITNGRTIQYRMASLLGHQWVTFLILSSRMLPLRYTRTSIMFSYNFSDLRSHKTPLSATYTSQSTQSTQSIQSTSFDKEFLFFQFFYSRVDPHYFFRRSQL